MEVKVDDELFGEKKAISCYTNPSPRSFALFSTATLPDPTWYTCREQFATPFTNDKKEILFCHNANCDKKIVLFIRKVEEILNFSLSEENEKVEPIEFCKTTHPHVLYLKISNFWSSCEMRRQLLTILLRCGQNYNSTTGVDYVENNFEQALWSEIYASGTKNAVMRFLFGFTEYINDTKAFNMPNKIGWYNCWANKDAKKVVKQLVNSKKTISTIKMEIEDCIFE